MVQCGSTPSTAPVGMDFRYHGGAAFLSTGRQSLVSQHGHIVNPTAEIVTAGDLAPIIERLAPTNGTVASVTHAMMRKQSMNANSLPWCCICPNKRSWASGLSDAAGVAWLRPIRGSVNALERA